MYKKYHKTKYARAFTTWMGGKGGCSAGIWGALFAFVGTFTFEMTEMSIFQSLL